ncbi:type VI secretion system baseplate subunit TssF [Rugamonas sp. CCM 8940]|uniref:type VI secretion system baseplate subunit TssF n=1 Tax=Rugamonas sp. CCM 8940 TaxID=2765359 RepID=UPI0018F3093D|nr:type VI secretion system baseplate subunit TssF [Rugamonas sp. CCM 8940]MBJ7314338.1 type VI secretion system baseplate subunit TssF [Rugamonas sp. CCM 8940]
MKKLRTHYERELGALDGYAEEFAAEFPAEAGKAGMLGRASEDTHSGRIIQASALSNARTAQLIEDSDARFTEALLNVNYPHYLQPFPATAIVGPDLAAAADSLTTVGTIPRGTMMNAKLRDGTPCRFRSSYDMLLAPVLLSKVAFHPIIDIPPALPRPATVSSSLSIVIECGAGSLDLKQLALARLRVFIDADQSLCAITRDVLFMRAESAYIELAGEGGGAGWTALDSPPIRPVGFAPEDALIPFKASSHPAYRLLTEYFAFPEKFNFFDIDWPQLSQHLPAGCRRISLHLGLSGVAANSATARSLATLSSKNFLLACTPVVNLFRHSACPIDMTHTAPDYELIPNGAAHAHEIHSVDKVYVVRNSPKGQAITEFRPYYSLRHGEAGGHRGRYYLVRRDGVLALSKPGHEMRIALVDLDLDPMAVEHASVSIDLTCSNRDLAGGLRYGAAGGDLELEQSTAAFPLRFLRKPTPPHRFGSDAHWRLIALLSLSHSSLVRDGVDALKEILTLHDLPQSPVTQRQIGGITGLAHRPARTRLRKAGASCLVHGIEVLLTLDEDAFAGSGLHLFAQVLDHFFGLYVHINSYIQLTVLSQSSGEELIRCPPRNGAIHLV